MQRDRRKEENRKEQERKEGKIREKKEKKRREEKKIQLQKRHSSSKVKKSNYWRKTRPKRINELIRKLSRSLATWFYFP